MQNGRGRGTSTFGLKCDGYHVAFLEDFGLRVHADIGRRGKMFYKRHAAHHPLLMLSVSVAFLRRHQSLTEKHLVSGSLFAIARRVGRLFRPGCDVPIEEMGDV